MTLAMDPAPYPPALRGWLDAHSRLRRDADALYDAAVNLDPKDTAAAAALAGQFTATARMLHTHHRFEDDVLFPTAVEHEPGGQDGTATVAETRAFVAELARLARE